MNRLFAFDRLFPRWGGWYLMMIVAVIQIVALLGALPGYVSISFNIAASGPQNRLLGIVSPVFTIVGFITLLLVTYRSSAIARKQMDEIAAGQSTQLNAGDEFLAWREITSLTWKFGFASVLIGMTLIVLPTTIIAYLSEDSPSFFAPTSLNSNSSLYYLLGGTSAVLGYSILAVFLLGRFTLQIREILIPRDFEVQLRGRAGALVISKFLILIVALILITLFLFIPIGYQQSSRILFTNASPMAIFEDFQSQVVFFTALILILGVTYSYYASRSISDPVGELIRTFEQIESGNLSARAPISATDELGIVTMQFNRMVARLELLQTSLELQVADRTGQLSATNEVGRVASSSLDPDDMLSKVVSLFTEQFGYESAAVYLIDTSGKWADLKKSSVRSDASRLHSAKRVDVASKGLVGSAIRERLAHVEDLPNGEDTLTRGQVQKAVRSEIALTLLSGDRVLGALSLNSSSGAEFGAETIKSLQNMAGQVAIALENARLFQETQQNLRELRAVQQQYLLAG